MCIRDRFFSCMFIYPRIELAFAVNGLELSCSLHAPRGHSCTSCPLILQAGPWTLKSPKTRKGDKNCFRTIIDDDHLFPQPSLARRKSDGAISSVKIMIETRPMSQSLAVPAQKFASHAEKDRRWSVLQRSSSRSPCLQSKPPLAFPSRSYVKKCRSLSSVSLSVNSLFSTRDMRELCVWKE